MAIMWNATAKAQSRPETAAEVAWRLRFAQMLIASGFEAAVVREALVPNDGTVPDFATHDIAMANEAAQHFADVA